MNTIIVRYAEIALKGENRNEFERQLTSNIRRALGPLQKQVIRQRDQVLVRVQPEDMTQAKAKLRQVFGIAWFAEVTRCDNTMEDIMRTAFEVALPLLDEHTSFAVRARRSNKYLPFNSREVNYTVGGALQDETGAPVDLSNPDVTVRIAAKSRGAYIYAEKIAGPGGLPVGTNGRVLSLLSGGFDSIASSYKLAKRGARVDFLHFHVFPRKEGVLNTKMPALWGQLSDYTLSRRVYLADYTPFQMTVLDLPTRLQKYELVTFRRLMARVGEKLAERHGYDALVLGDSLGQVASQTMANISAVDRAVQIPIFRPLIGSDKVEVINLVTEMGMEEVATAPYKDCCSLIARHPATRANMEKVLELEDRINVEAIADDIAEHIDVVRIGDEHAEGDEQPRGARKTKPHFVAGHV